MTSIGEDRARSYLADAIGANVIALWHALERCDELGIRAFRINSQMLPLATHPRWGYHLTELPGGEALELGFRKAATLAARLDIALSVHPDQYNVLNSVVPAVVDSTIKEIEHQALFCEMVGATTICVHGGSKAGGLVDAQQRLRQGIERLSDRARSRLALENDDRSYTVSDLSPVCRDMCVPLIYDVHHHRCNGDGLSEEEATRMALESWLLRSGPPWFHISSPRSGWNGGDPRPHSEFINERDIPECWSGLDAVVDVEAKAKESAVVSLYELRGRAVRTAS